MGIPDSTVDFVSLDWKQLPLSSHQGFSRFMTFSRRRLAFVLAIFLLFAYVHLHRPAQHVPLDLTDFEERGSFNSFDLHGFINPGIPSKDGCDALRYDGTIGVQQSFHLPDNLTQIALSLDTNPMISYPKILIDDENMTAERLVELTWGRCSGSSVWLPNHQVFLVVTRAFYHDAPINDYPKISFIRGQVFNSRWEHLDNHTITWQDRSVTFPTVFDVGTEARKEEPDRHLYGPEDPRIILEDFEGAEPVVVFNMATPSIDWDRAMYVFRPFSNIATMLEIRNRERRTFEKNWVPFFDAPEPRRPGIPRQPSEYIHFLYSFKPMRVLKCHLRCGDCELVYEQSVPAGLAHPHDEKGSFLSGGTNFVPVPIPSSMKVHPEIRIYAAFARTQVQRDCGGRIYRPEFVVMTSFRQNFHLAFSSIATDFGDALLGPRNSTQDPCSKGRILIPNSMTHIDSRQGEDVMEVMFSVDDLTVQVARVHGLLAFVQGLPQFKNFFRANGPLASEDADYREILSSWASDEVRACTVESAVNDTLSMKVTSEKLKLNSDKPLEVDKNQELVAKIEKDARRGRQRLKQESEPAPV